MRAKLQVQRYAQGTHMVCRVGNSSGTLVSTSDTISLSASSPSRTLSSNLTWHLKVLRKLGKDFLGKNLLALEPPSARQAGMKQRMFPAQGVPATGPAATRSFITLLYCLTHDTTPSWKTSGRAVSYHKADLPGIGWLERRTVQGEPYPAYIQVATE